MACMSNYITQKTIGYEITYPCPNLYDKVPVNKAQGHNVLKYTEGRITNFPISMIIQAWRQKEAITSGILRLTTASEKKLWNENIDFNIH